MPDHIVIIVGAGPAGLTAAYELLQRTDYLPVILEKTDQIGGISRTANYHGNRMDMGGHRFFSKDDRIMAWWQNICPLQGAPARDDLLLNRQVPLNPGGPDPEQEDDVLLVRNRLSRIYYLRSFFDYPVALNWNTVKNLGFWRMMKIGFGYLGARLKPRPEETLEAFFVNRFGYELYATFFRDYNIKVWGVSPANIPPDWGSQRVKGLSVSAVLKDALHKLFARREESIDQKEIETSLITRFTYPKHGPGALWESVADRVVASGGKLLLHREVKDVIISDGRVTAVRALNQETGELETYPCAECISTMPIKQLIRSLGSVVPSKVRQVSEGLLYRDFRTVGVLLKKLLLENETPLPTVNGLVPDNWIYIQERDVRMGRLQVFNNWSPYMVTDPDTVWLGLEYFCDEGDDLSTMSDDDLIALGVQELAQMGIIDPADVLDATTEYVEKAYPAYFGTYERFDLVREYLDALPNLHPCGRNGMHRYNNMDHSMLTAMTIVDNLAAGVVDHAAVWRINTEKEYHEQK